ncbi:Tannase and feruloyl esterase [Arachnomyces sp. PD_36]|nr:Tannase and feruloyl esterase [Arachnomyces sp. PD_36]
MAMSMAMLARALPLMSLVLGSQFPVTVEASSGSGGGSAFASRGQHQEDVFQSGCSALASQISDEIPNAQVNIAEFIEAGTNLTLDQDPSCYGGVPSQIVSAGMCRVALDVKTSNSSGIVLEAWLPQNYTGRFLSVGNGGLGGCIQYPDIEYGVSLGFATVGANNGHAGMSGKPFYKNPEVLEDFAYRSIHTGVVVGKQITDMFYEESFDKSYYLGCSTGGRQGFKSAQQFPEDFDGIVAGAPAISFNGLVAWSANFLPVMGAKDSDTYVTPELWAVVHEEILRQCDGLDGAEDGVIEDPDMCHPTWDTLICGPGQKTGCLTSVQANTVEQVFSPFYGEDGELIYPRMQPGSEITARESVYTGLPYQISTEWFQNVVYEDRTWDAYTFTRKDAEAALAANPYNIDTFEGDLSAFQKAGGKLLTYHGLQDDLISSEISKLYYSHVAQTMELPPSELDAFYRFFPISGMDHCGFGPGAYAIGNGNYFGNPGPDPKDNVLMAAVQWVEEGIAPETVRGTKFSDENPTEVEFRRNHCRWPKRNVFTGPGNYTDENSWECVI